MADHLFEKDRIIGMLPVKVLCPVRTFEVVEGPGHGQCFKACLVHCFQVYPFGHIKYACKRAVFLFLGEDSTYRSFADPLDGTKAKTHHAILCHREVKSTFINIRAQHINILPFTFLNEEGDLFNIIQVMREHGSHIFSRVMCFEVCSLVGDQ